MKGHWERQGGRPPDEVLARTQATHCNSKWVSRGRILFQWVGRLRDDSMWCINVWREHGTWHGVFDRWVRD